MTTAALQTKAFQNLALASTELSDAQLMMMYELEKNKSHKDIDVHGGLLESIDGRMISASRYLTDMPEEQINSSDAVKSLFNRVATQYNETAERINALASKAKGQPINIFPKIDFNHRLKSESNLPHQENISPYPQETPLTKRQIRSFKIEPASKSTISSQKTISLLENLHSISQLFRNAKEAEAMKEFSKLEQSAKGKIFELLWIIRGRRLDYPGDFGKDSFIGDVDAIKSTPHQKACAIEYFILEETDKLAVQTMLQELKMDNFREMKQIFYTLPLKAQGEIFSIHWKICGEPTDKSSDENLKKMAHGDFGRVSFLNLEPRCNVPLSKKMETLQAYLENLSSFRDERFKLAEQLINAEVETWKQFDQSGMKGQEKNDSKRAALFPFANKLARLYLPLQENQDIVAIPTISKPDGSEVKKFEAYAAAYVKKYPCLKPFFLQLVDKLDLQDEGQLPPLPIVPFDLPKPLQILVPQPNQSAKETKRLYLTEIMKDTLETLLMKGYYVNSKSEKVSLDLNPAAQSVYCQSNDGGEKTRSGPYRTQLFLVNKDFLSVAKDCVDRKLDPIVVDAASERHFGGNYLGGSDAQEERFSRRSGLPLALDPAHKVQQKNFYPLTQHGENAVLYVAHVPVFRGEGSEGYPYLNIPFEVSVAVVAAENFNVEHQKKIGILTPKQLIEGPEGELSMPPDSAARTKKKLRTVLETAHLNGHKSIILVPVGCGAFQNPPSEVSKIMLKLITEEFPHSFEEIHIAILEDHNSGQRHNPRGNFAEFKDVIENQFTEKLQNAGIDFKVVS